jgi:mannose-6-phosphate isomerase-like protein (cupin superfamily)
MQRAHEVRDVVQQLKDRKRREADTHRLTRRPWGSFESLHHGVRHQVKHLVLNPGAAISLQLHNHRSEHWVVVTGRARVTVDDEVRILGPNESAHIPVRARHRLENVGEQNLHVIEVQCGDYLGEDDIVRFEDKYRRA